MRRLLAAVMLLVPLVAVLAHSSEPTISTASSPRRAVQVASSATLEAAIEEEPVTTTTPAPEPEPQPEPTPAPAPVPEQPAAPAPEPSCKTAGGPHPTVYASDPPPPDGWCTWLDWDAADHSGEAPPAPFETWEDFMNSERRLSFVPDGRWFDMNDPSTYPPS